MNEKRYGTKVDDVDNTIIDITEDGNDFAWFLNDDITDKQVDKVVQRLNELTDEIEQLKHQNEMLSDELEQCKAVVEKRWSEYLQKKELENG